MVKYKDCKKTKTTTPTWKDLQKAWSTTAEDYLKIQESLTPQMKNIKR